VRAAEQAKILLESAAGKAKQEIAQKLGIARQTVQRWEKRFLEKGTKGLEDAPRSGRPRGIQPEQVAQIIRKTAGETPPDSTHWTTRSMAEAVGVSPSAVGRIPRSADVQPHRVRTFKLSNDPEFAGKTGDIVDLHRNPPPHSVIGPADEQCQLQALERTQAGLPCVPAIARPGPTVTHAMGPPRCLRR
jgi:transposase